MATYPDLSDEDKAVIDNFTNVMRQTAGEIGRMFNHIEAIYEDTNAVAIFGTLDGASEVPNASGLAGADSMTKAQLQSVYTDWGTMKTSHNTTAARNLWTQMAGIQNMIG